MKTSMKKILLSTTIVGAGVAASVGAIAATTNIDAVANFLASVTLGAEVDMDFGTVEFSAAPAAGDTASLGTDGSVVYAGNFSGGGTGTAGSVDITAGTNGNTVDVFCDSSAVMSNGAAATINVVGIEAVGEGAEAAYGSGSSCNGVAGAVARSLVLNVGTLDTFVFGGQIDGSTAASFVAGSYSTANAGGDDIQVDVFYQ